MTHDTPSKKTKLAWAVLCCSLIATLLVTLRVKHEVERNAASQFAYASDQIALKIRDRLAAQELILRGGAGLLAAADVDRHDWRRYWEALRPESIMPGVQGFGFSLLIAPEQLGEHIAQVRGEGFPDYSVRPGGERTSYSSIVYLEPFRDRNLRAFGYDMFAEPVRHAAMAKARDSGLATLSGKVELVQETDTDVQPGVLMYVPVYRKDMPTDTVPQRRAALIGWSYSPYRMVDLMTGILGDWQQQLGKDLHLDIHDGPEPTAATRIYSSRPAAQVRASASLLRQQRHIDFNGHGWLLVLDRDPRHAAVGYTSAWAVAAGGLSISGLLFWLLRSLLNTRYHAHRIAQQLTQDIRQRELLLQASEHRWSFALDGSGMGVWDWDIAGGTVLFAKRWKEMLGHAEHEIGANPDEWETRIHPDDRQATLASIQACVAGQATHFENEHRLRCKDGSYIWVHDRGMVMARDADGRPQRMIGTHSDITAQKLGVLRVQQLARLYAALSECNAAIARCTTQGELFARICEVVVRNAGMKLAWIGLVDPASGRIEPTYAFGDCTAYLHGIEVSVRADDPHGQGSAGTAVRENQPVWLEDFSNDPRTAPWHERAQRHGIASAASLPVRRAGKPIGALTFYAAETGMYDQETRALFESMTTQISYALDKFDSEATARSYQETLIESGRRLQSLFEATPLPMQIHALADLHITGINQAHQRWLGYSLEEIESVEQWLERTYPSPMPGEQFMAIFQQTLEKARHEQGVQLPERTLRCKDGSTRVALPTMTVVGDDIIVAWTDLSEVRRGEQALRDSEQRFRNMVEQSISGMYVRRDGRFIYVNPRFCEITGWPAHELLGQQVLPFTPGDDTNLEHIRQIWARLESGERNVAYSVPLRRKDGGFVELGLNASMITWDDGLPATIVMAQDITARKRAEEQIAAYVKQLEGAMRGTLQAVSTMVELRDPYTAGHERRVGLIAGAIAREMGWADERCDELEMVGLVHDIGKIAVPSELLTKPGRLNHLEMELMKGHAQAGYDILKDVPFGTPVAEIIRQHHERIDGSGYPRGLKGDEILPEARILAVADVVESMASHRPYRPALGLDAALEEVEKGKGRHYDSAVVEALVRLVKERGYTLPQ